MDGPNLSFTPYVRQFLLKLTEDMYTRKLSQSLWANHNIPTSYPDIFQAMRAKSYYKLIWHSGIEEHFRQKREAVSFFTASPRPLIPN